MSGEMQRPDPSQLRISDADRHKVAEVLREAAGEGRIDLDELDERLEAAYAAKTYADLVPLTIDLPGVRPAGSPATPVPRPAASVPVPTTTHSSSVAVMSNVKRTGAWLVPEESSAMAFMGEVTLDLRQATLAATEISISASAIMGEVKILVDEHTVVELDGTPIMGEYKQNRDQAEAQIDDQSPTVRVRGMALMGTVSVTRKPPPGTPKRFFGTH